MLTAPDLLSEGAIDDCAFAGDALDDAWRVPESLAGVIEKQVERLPGELRFLLAAAAVAGVEFRPETVADITGKDAAWVHERCDRLARRYAWLHLVGAGRGADGKLDARYAFRHALYRHVLYQRMTDATRVEMHLLAGRSMERSRAERPAASPELAMHYERGRDLSSALRHYADATAHAIRSFAPTEATQITEHALALVPQCADTPERHELELAMVAQRGIACSQLFGVASPAALQAFERARALLDPLPAKSSRAWVLSGLAWVYYVRGEFDSARWVAQRIHELGQQNDDPVLLACACNLLGVTIGYHSDLRVARQWLERGIAICVELGDRLPFSQFVLDPRCRCAQTCACPWCRWAMRPMRARRWQRACMPNLSRRSRPSRMRRCPSSGSPRRAFAQPAYHSAGPWPCPTPRRVTMPCSASARCCTRSGWPRRISTMQAHQCASICAIGWPIASACANAAAICARASAA